ncbi:uncharacterized protein LOC107623749 isoform X1 [Arachis ipaensis]|uniref:uncharacterized protein LOC107623749 isoform X1 n=1 Tax=Arachis ipaensis TaxID=130454 RepID=UPI000A2AF7AF|nr:uncharacterized protein LOC107623749 isoform X1 [Arachis ipaensis]XP_020970488.1 uncharacterized protein LOC107623749 isoform X1 [Arachis ipaensis]
MSFFLSPSTSFFRHCRHSSRPTISLCHPLRRTSPLLVVLLLRFLSHAGISKPMRRCGMVVDFYASCFLTVSQSSTATTLRWCFALNRLQAGETEPSLCHSRWILAAHGALPELIKGTQESDPSLLHHVII